MKIIALLINLLIVFFELYTLMHIKKKLNILKYYTYLQNFLALIASLIFSICLIVHISTNQDITELVKGLRYVETCGLIATMFIFVVFLGAGKKVAITEEDFLCGFSPKTANAILHYICPALSFISLVFFERDIKLISDIWTVIVAAPSCLYWVAYFILSATKLWEEPYNFSSSGAKNNVSEILSIVLIPLSFIAISFVLWNVM